MSKQSEDKFPSIASSSCPTTEEKGSRKAAKNKVTIDVNCKQFKMLFATDFNRPKKRVSRGRATRSKSKTVPIPIEEKSTTGEFKKPAEKMESLSLYSQPTTSGGFKLSRKKTEVLGCVNTISARTPPPGTGAKLVSSDTKREKRKRFAGDDSSDIAAENIPLESAFPPLQFGVVSKEISPKKRRRLQSLISPKSPKKFSPFF